MLKKRMLALITAIVLCVGLLPAFTISVAAAGEFPVAPSNMDIIHNPNTFCNPISVTAGTGAVQRAGEPVIRVFDGGPGVEPYYILAIGAAQWWSYDFVDWTRIVTPAGALGPVGGITDLCEIDGKLYNYGGNKAEPAHPIRYTDDPKSGRWYSCGRFSGPMSNTLGDAAMLYDEETGRLFMFTGLSPMFGTRVIEYDKESFVDPTRDAVPLSKPVVVHWANHHNYGWEVKRVSDYVYPYFRDRDSLVKEYPWTEGPLPLKYNGKYYMLFSSNGIEQFSYAQGTYVADDPMGPYEYSPNNPLTRQITGAVRGAGHGAIFVDKQDKVWCVAMLPYPRNGGSGSTLMALYPCDVDEDGMLYADLSYGDHPQYLPGKNPDPSNDNTDQFTGWAQLSLYKEVEVSSALDTAHRKEYAVNEDPMSSWCAASGAVGEWITVDLGATSDIRGIQMLWDNTGTARAPGYTVEVSNDNATWDLIIDKTTNPQDLKSDYVELPAAVAGRYVKVTNKTAMTGTNRFAVQGLRVFGNPGTATYTKANNVKVVRSELDRMNAHLLWDPVPGAGMYVVRYGTAPDKLHNSYKVFKDTYLDLYSLGIEPEYCFEVEAVYSGTPLYNPAPQPGAELVTDPVIESAYDKSWVLLSLDKEVLTSSIYDTRVQNTQHPVVLNTGTFKDYWPAYAVDENPNTLWSAVTGTAGEYITVDLGAVSDIRGVQIKWNRAGAFGFTVEVSNNNKNWTRINATTNAAAVSENYIELTTPATGRYVKLTNAKATPDIATPDVNNVFNPGGRFAVTALRVFGNPDTATFTKVNNVKVVRSERNPHYAHLLWDEVAGAEGYVVRYGTNAANLDKSYTVFWNSYLDIPSLELGQTYSFEVEAFSSGTPRWVENTYETRGRGANIEFNIPGTPAIPQQRFNYLYETYGRDEVYTPFVNLTRPGYYRMHQGNIFWEDTLTVADLIGPATGVPSKTYYDCMEFGSGTTPWGTVDVRVYPGPTGGSLEVTLRYYNAQASIRADEANVIPNSPVSYTVSLSNMEDVNLVTLKFTASADYVNLNLADSFTAENGFSLLGPVAWKDLGGNLWQGTVKLMCPAGFVTQAGPLDILTISGVAKDALGDATITLTDLTVVGRLDGNSAELPSLIKTAEATTSVVARQPVYSKYDLNRDGKIDDLDLGIAIYFYLRSSTEPNWETPEYNGRSAKDADVTGNGLVDLADLVEIMANYTDSYNLFP